MIRLTRLSLEEEINVQIKRGSQSKTYTISISFNGLHDTKKGVFVQLGDIRKLINKFDYATLSKYFKIPSAENLSRYFALKLLRKYSNKIIEVTVSVYNSDSSVATSNILNPKFEKNSSSDIKELSKEEKKQVSSEVNSIAFSLELHPDDLYKALAVLKQENNGEI